MDNKKVKVFDNVVGVHCKWSSISNVIRHYVNPFTENAIFLEYNGLNTEFVKGPSLLEPDYLSNNFGSMYENFFRDRGTEFNPVRLGDCISELTELLHDRIEKGYLPIISLDTKHIDYHPIFKRNMPNSHYVVVKSIGDDSMEICDCLIPTSTPITFEGVISIDSMKDAWLKSFRNVYIVSENHINIVKQMMQSFRIKESLVKALSSYLKDGYKGQVSYLESLFPGNMIRDMEQSEIKEKISNLCFRLYFDAFFPARKVMYRILSEIATEDDIKVMDDFVQKWKNYTFCMLKFGISPSGLTDQKIDKIRRQGMELFEEEYSFYQRLCSLYS